MCIYVQVDFSTNMPPTPAHPLVSPLSTLPPLYSITLFTPFTHSNTMGQYSVTSRSSESERIGLLTSLNNHKDAKEVVIRKYCQSEGRVIMICHVIMVGILSVMSRGVCDGNMLYLTCYNDIQEVIPHLLQRHTGGYTSPVTTTYRRLYLTCYNDIQEVISHILWHCYLKILLC